MSPEQKVLWYSFLSLLSFIIIFLGPHFAKGVWKSRPEGPDSIFGYTDDFDYNKFEHNCITVFAVLSIISSFVFYVLAMSKIKEIKKTNPYRLSIVFLVITSIVYAILILLIFSQLFRQFGWRKLKSTT